MNFIRALLSSVDAYWSLVALPAIFVGVMAGVYFLPIPTLVVAILSIRVQFAFADACTRLGSLSDEPEEYVRGRNKRLATASLLILATLAAFGWHAYAIITSRDLCKDFSDYIPGTLPALLQSTVPHSCASMELD